MKRKQEKVTTKTSNKTPNKKYYVMFGFEEANPSNTVYLKIRDDGNIHTPIYNIVKTAAEATVFPAKNYSKTKGFGTPVEWADFFAEEEDLQEWNFHPVPYKMPHM